MELYEKREAPPAVFFDDPSYWESFVAEVDYKNGVLNEVRLVPIVLKYDPEKLLSAQRTTAGVPRIADGKQSKTIIENLARLSRLYGTDVKCRDGLGYINHWPIH